ncbi:MAG: hypothetical protein OXG72_15625 [Acidobacteria bacterium]|nr:hypothetical protein [Acidobacteriota bacterium]
MDTETGCVKLLFAARRSVRYHRHRESFLDSVHHAATLLTTCGALATIAAAATAPDTPGAWVLPAAAGITALAATHEAVITPARRARRHEVLAREFAFLERDLLRIGRKPNPEALAKLQTRRLEIEATEPPVYRVLDATCHDELVTALGHDRAQRTNVTRLQRLCRHFFDLAPHRIRKRAD